MAKTKREPSRISWIDRIQTTTESFQSVDRDMWSFTQGAKIVSTEEASVLELAEDARAEWHVRPIFDGRIDFRYRHENGIGLVLFRASAQESGRAYTLRIEKDRLTIQRKGSRRQRRLAEVPLTLRGGEWYDISIWLSGHTLLVAVDCRPILQIKDDLPLLRKGSIAFACEGNCRVFVKDIRLITVPRGLCYLPMPEPVPPMVYEKSKWIGSLSDATLGSVPGDVPLEVKPFLGAKQPAAINAGVVPPDYTHTWAIDVMGISSFSFQYSGIQLQWDAGDSLAVLNYALSHPVVETFASDAELTTKKIQVQPPPGGGYTRFYLTLRTGSGGAPRRFKIACLHAIGVAGNCEALLTSDDLNYDKPGPLVDPQTVITHEKLYAPWKSDSIDVPIGVSMPAPSARDGWYLLARNTWSNEAGFFTLLYYNERTSRLRAYLYNDKLSTDATYYQVTVSIATRAPNAGYLPLQGALFHADPRPQRWSTANFTIPVWPPKNWAFLETPILYPMAEKLAAAQHPPEATLPECYYRPLYEEACEHGLTNAKLVITVQGYQMGTLQGDFVGQALGEAVQKATSSGISGFDMIKGAASALASGKDYYDKGKGIHQALQDFLNDKIKAGTPKSELQGLQALVGFGASAFGGFLGVVGLGIGIYQAFFAKPEPLRFALELAIRGTMSGSVFTPLMSSAQTFFLPGRWSIQEAAEGNFPADNTQLVDAQMARYDRTLGHFGFRYDPGRVQFRLLQAYYAWEDRPDNPLADLRDYERYIFPASDHRFLVDPPTPNASVHISEWLPVIYNPFAEITPLTPMPVATVADQGIKLTGDGPFNTDNPDPWFEWLQDISPKSHIVPEPDDQSFPGNQTEYGIGSRLTIKVFPDEPRGLFPKQAALLELPNGIWLSIPPDQGIAPTTCRNFSEWRDIAVHTWWDVYVEAHRPVHPPEYQFSPYPLRDIIYYWDVAYFHYPRTRKAANGNVFLYRGVSPLLAPVSIDHRSVGFNYIDDDGVWFPMIPEHKSVLLLE